MRETIRRIVGTGLTVVVGSGLLVMTQLPVVQASECPEGKVMAEDRSCVSEDFWSTNNTKEAE